MKSRLTGRFRANPKVLFSHHLQRLHNPQTFTLIAPISSGTPLTLPRQSLLPLHLCCLVTVGAQWSATRIWARLQVFPAKL